jgi:LPS-assembly protein
VDGLIQALGANIQNHCVQRRFRPFARAVHLVPLFISTILLCAGHQHLHAQGVTTEEPPTVQASKSDIPAAAQQPLVDLSTIPHAFPLSQDKAAEPAVITSDLQSRHGHLLSASGNVELTYADHTLRADSLTYSDDTEDITAEGHVILTGGQNDERLEATHGTYNLRTQTGRFYDVNGSVGLSRAYTASSADTNSVLTSSNSGRLPGYENSNPFLFEGRIVAKTGPMDYLVYNGSVTSCLLPRPDWQLFARKISLVRG